jgi:DNA adenine methylase
MKPIIKWVGGKSQLLKELKEIITPELLENNTYYEVFAGGAALALDLVHSNTVLNDLNSELINMYKVIRDNPEELIAELKCFQNSHNTEFYYHVRNLDRTDILSRMSDVIKAARTIYLNKTCFNGLYRVNSKGQFNSPIGRTSSGKTPDIVQEELIRELSKFLKTVTLCNEDFENIAKQATKGSILFFDPPYDTDEDIKTDGFVGYQKEGWTREDTKRLKATCDELVNRGCKVVITNNDTEFVRDLFKDYIIKEVEVKRSINRDGNKRKGKEVIITNY